MLERSPTIKASLNASRIALTSLIVSNSANVQHKDDDICTTETRMNRETRSHANKVTMHAFLALEADVSCF